MPHDASSLHCPNCGAAVDPDAGRCPYCKARLATISCPECFALMFEGAAFCPQCGARAQRTERTRAGGRCPGCGAELHDVSVGDTSLLECPSCDGVWMDASEFERACASRETQAAVLHRFAAPNVRSTGGRVRYRPCVRCGKMMNRVNFGRLSGTVVDVCRGHGTFMDRGELHQIVSFIQAGGLDRARERRIDELKEEEQRLADAERRAASERATLGSHDRPSTPWNSDALSALIDAITGRK